MARILFDPRAIRAFRRAAIRAYPIEYLEALLGRRGERGTILLCGTQAIDHEATETDIDYSAEDTRYGERFGPLVRLGSIHSHPGCASAEPSETDWDSLRGAPELVVGIYAISQGTKRKETRLRFYRGAAPFEIQRKGK